MSRSSTFREWLAQFETLIEVGIGTRPEIAAYLSEQGRTVRATDIHPRTVPAGVEFVRDDITTPDQSLYATAEMIYARRLPPELHQAACQVARTVETRVCFTTLGGDPPAVPARPMTFPDHTCYIPVGPLAPTANREL